MCCCGGKTENQAPKNLIGIFRCCLNSYIQLEMLQNWAGKIHYALNNHNDYVKWRSEVVQSCLTLCDPMACSLPGSSVHGIFQARILEWVAICFSRGSSGPRDWTSVSRIVGRCFTVWATRGALIKTKFLSMVNLLTGHLSVGPCHSHDWNPSGSSLP